MTTSTQSETAGQLQKRKQLSRRRRTTSVKAQKTEHVSLVRMECLCFRSTILDLIPSEMDFYNSLKENLSVFLVLRVYLQVI